MTYSEDQSEEGTYLSHYGIIRRSGRYPWGSGGDAHGFLANIKELRDAGMSEAQVAQALSGSDAGTPDALNTTELRARISIARAEKKAADVKLANDLKANGNSNGAIATRMGLPGESSVRALLAPGAADNADKLHGTANMLKEKMAGKHFLDVGEGVESQLGISKEHLKAAIAVLEVNNEGILHTFNSPQVATGNLTKYRVIGPAGTTSKDAFLNRDNLKQIIVHSSDGGRHFDEYKPAIVVDPKRVDVKYGLEGGAKADGVIYVRPDVPDLSLGRGLYAQVRVQVGPDHYLKGMAVYKDGLPTGVDLQFNTNKSRTDNQLDAMKPIKKDESGKPVDPDLPFGSVVRQLLDKPGDPNAKPTSAMNIVNDEADWADWSKTISAQMLSKQNHKLVREQLDMTFERRKSELEEIKALTNPTVQKKLLEEFADSTDSAAVHLKAAQLDRSSWHVILPVGSIKPNEIFAPNFKDGERVVLIRYPHGGPFEIPELVVNNKQREARKTIGANAASAIGIHHTVAEKLSGADFDGDTVLVIPNDRRVNPVKAKPSLPQLVNFDPKHEFPKYEGMKVLSNTGAEMGAISNLVTDMTIKQASNAEIARAIKHSMVVIDAEKHELNYKLSAQVNGIKALKEKYQTGGASTLISRAKAKEFVDKRKPRLHGEGGPVDLKTGERKFQPTGEMKVDKKGNLVPKQQRVERLALTNDAHTLSSGTPVEIMYADHSNRLKAMANQARLDAINTPHPKRSPSAAKVYANEVQTLNAKLKEYRDNKPAERQANLVANQLIRERLHANPNLDKSTIKKVRAQSLRTARARLGVKRIEIKLEDREWEAIQAGAISNAKLSEILKRVDNEQVKKLATPKTHKLMTNIKTQRATAMLASGYTRREVADALGVSLSTLDDATTG